MQISLQNIDAAVAKSTIGSKVDAIPPAQAAPAASLNRRFKANAQANAAAGHVQRAPPPVQHAVQKLSPSHSVASLRASRDVLMVSTTDEFCIENHEFCIRNEKLCITNDEFRIKRMNFAGKPREHQRQRWVAGLRRADGGGAAEHAMFPFMAGRRRVDARNQATRWGGAAFEIQNPSF